MSKLNPSFFNSFIINRYGVNRLFKINFAEPGQGKKKQKPEIYSIDFLEEVLEKNINSVPSVVKYEIIDDENYSFLNIGLILCYYEAGDAQNPERGFEVRKFSWDKLFVDPEKVFEREISSFSEITDILKKELNLAKFGYSEEIVDHFTPYFPSIAGGSLEANGLASQIEITTKAQHIQANENSNIYFVQHTIEMLRPQNLLYIRNPSGPTYYAEIEKQLPTLMPGPQALTYAHYHHADKAHQNIKTIPIASYQHYLPYTDFKEAFIYNSPADRPQVTYYNTLESADGYLEEVTDFIFPTGVANHGLFESHLKILAHLHLFRPSDYFDERKLEQLESLFPKFFEAKLQYIDDFLELAWLLQLQVTYQVNDLDDTYIAQLLRLLDIFYKRILPELKISDVRALEVSKEYHRASKQLQEISQDQNYLLLPYKVTPLLNKIASVIKASRMRPES